MLSLDEFKDYPELENLISKINKYLRKEKEKKVYKYIEKLGDMIHDSHLIVPVTYILSIFAEQKVSYISEDFIKDIKNHLNSDNVKLKLNSIIVIGFYLLSNKEKIKEFSSDFMDLIFDKSLDVRENVFFFLHEFVKNNPNLLRGYKNTIIKAIEKEKNDKNLFTLLDFLKKYGKLNFRQAYTFRKILIDLIDKYYDIEDPAIFPLLLEIIKKFYPALEEKEIEAMDKNTLKSALNDLFLMKKYNFTRIARKKNLSLKKYLQKLKKEAGDEELFFYLKDREKNIIFLFELERENLLKIFEGNNKLSRERLLEIFEPIIDSEYELEKFMKTLMKIHIIDGFFSKFYFYPSSYLKNDIKTTFKEKGIINLKNYNYLPPQFVHDVIQKLSDDLNLEFLVGRNGRAYYYMKKIQDQIKEAAAKNSSIELKAYRERLKDEDFIKLVKNLPSEYLTEYRKNTTWLTNIGRIKVLNEINNSKIVGFFKITKVSEKLNIKQELLHDVLAKNVDKRSGMWDKYEDIFYYSKYIKEKIDVINTIVNPDEKQIEINKLSRDLNIPKEKILGKIDENYKSIGNEIKQQEEIKVSEYTEKLGMERERFINFINELGMNYFIKGDTIILSQSRIESAKTEIKRKILEKSSNLEYFDLGSFDIKSDLIEELIKEMEQEKKLNGIFYRDEEGNIKFYTENGIKTMMMENMLLFSFHDLFYGKDLNQHEIDIMLQIFYELKKNKKLRGHFDKETLTFSSDDILFANDYNMSVDKFGQIVQNYVSNFNLEYEKIKRILAKRNEIIYPQEIKQIQEIIEAINVNYVKWRSELDSLINRFNREILKQQGMSMNRYKGLPLDKKEEIKIFKDDQEVQDYLELFNSWVKLFNELEAKYGEIIFLQKALISNPDSQETEEKLEELLEYLSIIEK